MANPTNEDTYLINQEEEIRKREAQKTNKYKTRIIDSEINSSVFLATLIHYNIYYSIVCFSFQFFALLFKLWVFKLNSFTITRFILEIFWGIVEIYRLNIGFKANINESFPSLIIFLLISIVFSIAPQVLLIVGPHVLPLDISTVIIQFIFIFLEIIVCIFTMKGIINTKTALYILRNTSTVQVKPNFTKNKSSEEIAHEVEELLMKEERNKELFY